MIYPDVTVEEWFKKHPCFEKLSAEATCLCGERSVEFRAFVTADYAGIEASHCVCGRAGVRLTTPTSQTKKRKWETLYYSLMGVQ